MDARPQPGGVPAVAPWSTRGSGRLPQHEVAARCGQLSEPGTGPRSRNDVGPWRAAHWHARERREDNRQGRAGVLGVPNFAGVLDERLPRRVPGGGAVVTNPAKKGDLALLDDHDRAAGMRVPAKLPTGSTGVAVPGTALTATNSPASPSVMSARRVIRFHRRFICDSFSQVRPP